MTKALFRCLQDGQSSSQKAGGCPILSARVCACISVFMWAPSCVYVCRDQGSISGVVHSSGATSFVYSDTVSHWSGTLVRLG